MSSLIGQQWGNYRLIRLLGRGGFAEVYLGEHAYLGMQAAIKILRVDLSPKDMQAFRQEARVIAELAHPHIIRLLDFDLQNDRPFLVLEYAANGTLGQKHPRGTKIPLPLVLRYLTQIGEALHYAHAKNLIHRDIKPENILIGENGKILLGDFGIVTMAQASNSLNTPSSSMGTLAYMAPEQINGHPQPASDQYALAVMVYQWLTGVLPFCGSITEILAQQLAISPPPLREHEPSLSQAVEEVVLIALAKDPAARFQTVRAFVNALQQAAHSPQSAVQAANVGSAMFEKTLSSTLRNPDLIMHQETQPVPAVSSPQAVAATLQAAPERQEQAPSEYTAITLPPDTPSPVPEPRRAGFWRTLLLSGTAALLICASGLGLCFAIGRALHNQQPAGHNQPAASQTVHSSLQGGKASATSTVTLTVVTSPTPSPTPSPRPTSRPAPAPTLDVVECDPINCSPSSTIGRYTYTQKTGESLTASYNLIFTNYGSVTVSYTFTSRVVSASNPNWTSIPTASPSGSLAPDGQLTETIYVDATNTLAAGTYETDYTFACSYQGRVFTSYTDKFILTVTS